MGLMPHDFYCMTWKDYSRAAQGYWLRHSRYMEGVRRLAYFTVISNADPKKSRSIKEDRLFRLITDQIQEQPKAKRLSSAEIKALLNRYKK